MTFSQTAPTRMGRLLVACLVQIATPFSAIAVDDLQSWNMVAASTKFGDRFSGLLEGHGRFYDDARNIGQWIVRPSLTYHLAPQWDLTAGYFYGENKPIDSEFTREQRFWQQATYKNIDVGPLLLTSRSRLEQRFSEAGGEVGWRWRQLFRSTVPFNDAETIHGVVANELFVGLHKTDWGQRGGLDQNRLFAGVSHAFSPSLTIEPGVLYQHVFRDRGDMDNIVASFNVLLQF